MNSFGQVVSSAQRDSTQRYSYDAAGRLTQTLDTVTAGPAPLGCTTRRYAYDANSNRLSLTTLPPAGTACASTGGVTTSHAYDAADRLLASTDPGLAYDAFGRITTLPSADGNGGGDVTATYYLTD